MSSLNKEKLLTENNNLESGQSGNTVDLWETVG
jgi:hypothetical protein